MTRINLISPEELSDRHLIAEFRELPRIVNAVVKGRANTKSIPESYALGKGHVKFFYNKILFLAERYTQIYAEMKYRGFKINELYLPNQMIQKIQVCNDYIEQPHIFSKKEIDLSQTRIMRPLHKPTKFVFCASCSGRPIGCEKGAKPCVEQDLYLSTLDVIRHCKRPFWVQKRLAQ